MRLKDGKLVWGPEPFPRRLPIRPSVQPDEKFPKFYPHSYRDIKGELQGDIAYRSIRSFFMAVYLLIATAIIFSAGLIVMRQICFPLCLSQRYICFSLCLMM